ncbi:MAG: thioredoxin domain-containing protein, partial [Planctomycetota bacterium]
MPNRLAHSTSPYLLQHKDNPVDWHEWGPEAFGLARSRGVPIFLSIGYSTCYWCHVMERESFEDDETAGVLNAGFVPVKVDREQRPDVDELYMAATQILTGHGGWPMSVFIEPEALRPFWAGTYYPKEPRHGLPSFTQVLGGMSDAYANKRGDVLAQAERLAEAVAEHLAERPGPVAVGPSQVTAVVGALLQSHDRVEGGFGGAPKFPQPVYLEMLLDAREAAADDATRDAIDAALRLTLDRMALGGLFDQAGGGFHRYCVDATWTVPHFEKMLYDNAQLASVYGRAAALYGDAFYGGIVERTLWYVEREMTAPGGGLYSAQDAEVDGREGLNYLWTDEQAAGVLTEGELGVAREHYPLGEPNFTDPHHPEDGPTTVLRLAERPADPAALEGVNARLYEARQDRKQPHLDDKVLVSWNAMMISVLPPEPAARAAGFVLGQMRDEGGRLFRSWREGRADGDGVLEDYAAMISACCRLREVGAGGSDGVRDWLGEARALAEVVERDFAAGDGGYYDTRAGREDLFVRTRATYDGAIASGNALMLHALLDLHGLD